jgi:uncharacterized protein
MLDQLEWIGGQPVGLEIGENSLSFGAGPVSDWFADPRGAAPNRDAPIGLLAASSAPLVFEALVEVDLRATFDAAGLFVFYDDDHWLKFAIERTPLGEPSLVSVATDGRSDDCNHRVLPTAAYRLRLTVDEHSVAAHACADREHWDLLRYCPHPGDATGPWRLGFTLQSPIGKGTNGSFREITIESRRIEDLRNGD